MLALGFLTLLAAARALATERTPSAITRLYTFPELNWLENLAVRSNGELLMTSETLPVVYALDPRSANATPRTFVSFDSTLMNALSGITEYAPDQFAVIGSVVDFATFTVTNGTLWTFDARRPGAGPRLLARLPADAGFGNGLLTLPGGNALLVSDCQRGVLWRVELHSGAVSLAAQDGAFAIADAAAFPLGVNGIRLRGAGLLFVNTNQGLVGTVPIDLRDGSLAGNVSVLVRQSDADVDAGQLFDDFAVDAKGRMWLAAHSDAVDVVRPDGQQTVLHGFTGAANVGETGPTSAAFGRGSCEQEKVLYLTTTDGSVYALDTSKVELP